MAHPSCPACTLDDVLNHPAKWERAICGHEWSKEAVPDAVRVGKDAHGNVLAGGKTVVLIKGLKLRGYSSRLKGGSTLKSVRSATTPTRSTPKSTAARWPCKPASSKKPDARTSSHNPFPMGAKYLPTVRDQKASQRFLRQQQKQVRLERPATAKPHTKVQAKKK